MKKHIAVLPGDGIGEEVMAETLRVLDCINRKFGHAFTSEKALIGGAAYEHYSTHFPEETLNICKNSDAILFGSVGGPVAESQLAKWRDCERNSILSIRKAFQFNANFRPITVYPELLEICPLKASIVENGIDFLIIRELLGDIYFGEHKTEICKGKRFATDVAEYSEDQIAAIAHCGFQAAKKRRKKLTSVDKANVLDTSKLWRAVVKEVSEEYPDIQLEDMLVDNCAMQLIKDPAQFDVILTANLFGDILSDAGAVLPGSLGLLASASINIDGFGMYEPPGGSAPDIAGRGIANPIAQIRCLAMMFTFSFGLLEEASLIEQSISKVLKQGYRTKDIYQKGDVLLGTREMADKIIENLI